MTTGESLLVATRLFSRQRLHVRATNEQLAALEIRLGRRVPAPIRLFLTLVSNGAELNQFTIYPCAFETTDRKEVKWLWNSLQRNNDPEKNGWFSGDVETLKNFFVFATDGHACFTLPYGQDDPCVWMWEVGEEEMIELDYNFEQWMIESSVSA